MSLIESEIDQLEQDSNTVNTILATTANDSMKAWRYRTIIKMNPYMANNPTAVATMANMNIPTSELMSQAGALFGMQTANTLAFQMNNYTPSVQRSIFASLTPAQQRSLQAFGYKPPDKDVHEGGFLDKLIGYAAKGPATIFGGIGKQVAPALSPLLNTLETVGDYPFKVYRTIRQLDDASQWLSLAAGLGVAAAGILAFPVTGGASSTLLAAGLQFARVGLPLVGGMAAAGATSFVSSALINGGTSPWLNAWSRAYNGERLFTESGVERAQQLLEDPELLVLAQDLAAESEFSGDLFSIAQDIAGVRGSDNPATRVKQLETVAAKYATPGTPAFDQAYETLSQIIALPRFTEALNVLERSKISIGRDIVRMVGGDPNESWGRWMSGAFDTLSVFLIDPFILAGGVSRGIGQYRRGFQFVDDINPVSRMEQIFARPEMTRKLDVVARAVEAEDIALLNRGAREYKPIFDLLVFNRRQVLEEAPGKAYEAKDVANFLIHTDKLKSIMKGVGVVPGASYGQLRGLNRGQYAWAQATGATRDFMRGIADIRIENVRMPKIVKEILANDELRPLYLRGLDNAPGVAVDELVSMGLSEDAARVVLQFANNLQTKTILGDATETIDEAMAFFPDLDPTPYREAKDFLLSSLDNTTTAYRVGRIVGDIPVVDKIVGPLANFVEGITTRIPGNAIRFVGSESAQDIGDFVDLFRYVGMPSYIRNTWKNAILLSDTPGARVNGLIALMDSAMTASGMRLTQAGNDLVSEFLEKYRQMYGVGGVDRFTQVLAGGTVRTPVGTRPVADMATMFAVPDLHEMRKAVKQGYLIRTLMGIPENTHILALQNRYWKPAVLLRVGFILRNMSEETLSMLTRYGTGFWAQELAGRQVAQQEEYYRALNKARLKNQQLPLSQYEQYVLRKRFDVAIPLRPVARALERIPDGKLQIKIVQDVATYLSDLIQRVSERNYQFLLNGFGGQVAAKAKMSGLDLTADGAKQRIQQSLNRLAFGNQYSIRRMLAGGVDENILRDARAFTEIYMKQIMDTVGTSNLAPWQLAGDKENQAQRLLVDENGNDSVQLVGVMGERGLATRTSAQPLQQPYWEATLSRVQELPDDPIIDAGLDAFRRTYDADVQAVLPEENLFGALRPYAELVESGEKLDDDFLHLWTIVHEGIWNPSRFRAKLRQMKIPQSRLDEITSPSLRAWAEARNEMVEVIETAFPGSRRPTWEQIYEVLLSDAKIAEHTTKKFVLHRANPYWTEELASQTYGEGLKAVPQFESVDILLDDMVDVAGQPIDDILGYRTGFRPLNAQFNALNDMSAALADVGETGRDWFNQFLLSWHRKPDLINARHVIDYVPGGVRNRPPFMAYVGKQYEQLWDIDDEGNLVLELAPRDWLNSRPGVSLSLAPVEAYSYSRSGAGLSVGPEANVVFSIDGNALLAASNSNVDDIVATGYQAINGGAIDSSGNLVGDLSEFQPQMVGDPSFPFIPFIQEQAIFGREISIVYYGDVGTDAPRIVIPKGAWSVASSPESFGQTEKTLRAINASTAQNYNPFNNSLEEALLDLKMSAHAESVNPQWNFELSKNVAWAGLPDTMPIYVVDTRPLRSALGDPTADPQQRMYFVQDVVSRYFDNENLEDVWEMVSAALFKQQPILVGDQKTAEIFQRVIAESLAREAQTANLDRFMPKIGKSFFPTNRPIRGFGNYQVGYTVDGERTVGEFFGRTPDMEGAANYNEFPLEWDFIDNNSVMPGPREIMDRMTRHVEQTVRGGRRLTLNIREGENVPPIYRNVNGEAVRMEPGEIVEAHDELYLSEKLTPDSLIKIDDQRYITQGEVKYEGAERVMWPVLSPVLYDHAEHQLGWTLFDLKSPANAYSMSGNTREKIFLNRQRIRYASKEHVARTHEADLPDWQVVQLYRPVKRNTWDKVVQYGFSNIVGPVIDSLVRRPMAFHAFHIAAERNRSLTRWAIKQSTQEQNLLDVMTIVSSKVDGAIPTPEAVEIWADTGRLIGRVQGVDTAGNWSDGQAISFMRGMDREEFDHAFKEIQFLRNNPNLDTANVFIGMQKKDLNRLDASLDYASNNWMQLQVAQFDDSTDAFLNNIDRLFGEGSALAGRPTVRADVLDGLDEDGQAMLSALTADDWAAIKSSAEQRANINEEIYQYAAEHTIRDVMPYVDSHEVRSQYAEFMRGLLPFWYAEENFLKRWAKIFTEGGPAVTFERIRKLQLTYQGLKNVGIVRTDSQGKDYFVYPGSELFIGAVEKLFPGQMVPVSALMQTQTSMMIPGFTRDFGRPSLTPFAAVSMDIVTTLFPEARPFEEAFIGKEFSNRGITDAFVPRHISNVWNALGDYFNTDLNPKNQRIASAMNAAIAHLEANGEGLPENATSGQLDDYLRTVRNHARIIVLAQALGGFFTPGPSQMVQIGDGGSLDWITDGQITNPAELLSSQYYELVQQLGIEKGTVRFLELNQNATIHSVLNPLAYTVASTASRSGAPLASTETSMDFYDQNRELLDQYPEAGPWLLPQREDGDPRSQFAFDAELIDGLRDRRTPEEFVRMVKYKEGANYYFAAQKDYEDNYQMLQLRGMTTEAQALNRNWLMWAESFKATHPLFAEMLVSDDARQRRRRVIDQMRYLINDPLAPKASHFEALATLMRTFDAFSVARGQLGLDRTAYGQSQMNALKRQFRAWVTEFIAENPLVQPFWLSVLQPESGLE